MKNAIMKTSILAFLASALFNISFSFAQDGTLDKSFGVDGKVTVSFGLQGVIGRKAVLQPDGKIVQTGEAAGKVAVVRYNTDGTLDNSFNGNGAITTSVRASGGGNDVALQQDGKIVVGGFSYGSDGQKDFALLRYNTDGTLDNSFNDSGKVITVTEPDAQCNSLVIQPDGKIVAAGSSSQRVVWVVRYNSDGSLDNSFGENGKTEIDFLFGFSEVTSVIMQPGGKILLAGSDNIDFILVRYNSDGTLDTSFGYNGFGAADGTGNYYTDFVYGAALQPDGKIIAVGSASFTTVVFAIVRFSANGLLDDSFGENGAISAVLPHDAAATAVTVQPNSLILVAGGLFGANEDFALIRYKTNGSIDSSFGNNGVVTTDFNNSNDEPSSIIFSSGKIIVIGTTSGGFAIARYNAENTLPVTLVNFSAELKGNNVLLNWATAIEQNSNYFNIQRSIDGIHFTSVGRVNAAGISNIQKAYSYTDFNVTHLSSPKLYYRLQQQDKDGAVTYSSIKNVELNKPEFIIYPNPAKNFIFVQTKSKADVSLTDQFGRVLVTKTVFGDDIISTVQLPSGVYYLKNNATGETRKVVKE